jgi:hypothetical protein
MQTSRTSNNRQKWLNTYRIGSIVLLLALLAGVGVLIFRPAQPVTVTYTATQASKVERVASFLQDVGFNNPSYLGITPAVEGEYPTFQATAIGGKTIKLWIRTMPNGGWEIQPVGVFETVASADGFARLAQQAVYNWEHMPPDIKQRTDGAFGEYETRKYNFELLSPYNPDKSYWQTKTNETADWPRK